MDRLILPISKRDHVQGPLDAAVQLVEYGDYECPYCKAAFPVVKQIQVQLGSDLCFAFRHFPLFEIHPHAMGAAEAAESAAVQGRFWQMHDMLYENSPRLDAPDLTAFAAALGLELKRFANDLARHRYLPRIREDIESALNSSARGTPTFFINGIRHEGGYDMESLLPALLEAQQVST
jgi:protein-disulfide isomerase